MCADFILLYSIVILAFVTTCLWEKTKPVLKIKTSASDILQVCYLWFIAKATCGNLQ